MASKNNLSYSQRVVFVECQLERGAYSASPRLWGEDEGEGFGTPPAMRCIDPHPPPSPCKGEATPIPQPIPRTQHAN